ncbi:ABC transporter ATP-binding protein [Taibaiella soli]|uniref:ABC transporter ATP-binding protein n=1 Tax=Taibaiella soli TaxID=1649169 RepID=A0A2W2BJP9_9BACT|nr:ATP-binding cassette domain-containing protein [Taibaiella soli]PZF73666.1 ABC transporter ATP-binding protein [Taibaiella soli]
MIKLQNLSKSYGSKTVLQNINLQFERGHVYGIVGKNGAGKTTLFRCIAGLEDYSGNIQSDKDRLKDHLGLLLTEPYFFPKITGAEYIRLLCNARDVKVDNLDQRNVFDLPLGQYAATYSTGMKKKLALTALLLQQNEYFILDEPFNGVDIQSNIVIVEIIRKLRELGKTVIISSHIFSTLSETCDEIHLLREGEIVRSVHEQEFASLEQEMKVDFVGGLVERILGSGQ